MRRTLRLAAGALLCLIALPAAPASAATADPAPDPRPSYVGAHRLVDVGGGRRMNLDCRGDGPVTVVFDSGGSDWSSIWALVHPTVATRTRACTYDRAGMGYSDPSPAPRTPAAVVDDLHRLLTAARIDGPLVLVGHSLGGFNMKLYAATYPAQVAGLVLVDPSEDRSEARMGAALDARFGRETVAAWRAKGETDFAGFIKHFNECVEAARVKDLDPASDLYKSCTDPVRAPLGPEIAAERQRIQVRHAYQAAQLSEIANSIYGASREADTHYAALFGAGHPFGDRPLVVLTHSIVDMSEPGADMDFFEWNGLHEQTAALSRKGVHRIVPRTRHNIEIDDPKAIITAIDEVLKALAGPAVEPAKV